ncbi:hypothetical protein TsFJ059_006788 [Trichoderma semiorbis]|uniref:Uncharacterized protein n=1 Tax=Trichoderma semiorbis TaxID=1491008 RepID=A0A9P8KLD6_9HYPO|nr:hypothetical protein TsFJ059_006788 [Trichoderma semiorbis]
MEPTSSKGKERQPSIRFLNLTNPSDATKSDALTVIRSHVAKNTHGRKQESRRARLEIRQYRPETGSSKANDRWSQVDFDSQPVPKTGEFQLSVAPEPQHEEEVRPVELEIWMPNPQTYVTSNRRNPFQSTAIAVSDYENGLIDHYITYVVDNGYTDCIHTETEQLLLQNVRSQFVPWSLTKRGLQAGLLMAACRSLLVLHPDDDSYRVSLLRYKSECIQILRAALSASDGREISDYTIALALVLTTEEFLSGNLMEYRLHGEGILRMVHLRGGFKDLGPGGLLGYLLARSVYNPVFQFVDGPDTTSLVQ